MDFVTSHFGSANINNQFGLFATHCFTNSTYFIEKVDALLWWVGNRVHIPSLFLLCKQPFMVFCYQNCSNLLWDWIVLVSEKKGLKFEAEGQDLAKFLRSLEQFIQTVKGQNNFWYPNAVLTSQIQEIRAIVIQIGKKYLDLEICRKS